MLHTTRSNKLWKLLLITIIISFSGCKNSESQKEEQFSDINVNSSAALLNENIENLLPSPDALLDIIFKKRIVYQPNLLVEPDLTGTTLNTNFQAIILGIYIADFSYTLLYDDFNKSTHYFSIIKVMSEKVGISEIFQKTYFDRIEKNINNIDSLKLIYHDFSKNTFNTLSMYSSNELLSLVAIGVSMESIYLGYNVYKTESFNETLKPFFIQQKILFENFYQIYSIFNNGKDDLIKYNEDLKSFYALFKLNIWFIVDQNNLSNFENEPVVNVKYNVRTDDTKILELGNTITNIRNNTLNLNYIM